MRNQGNVGLTAEQCLQLFATMVQRGGGALPVMLPVDSGIQMIGATPGVALVNVAPGEGWNHEQILLDVGMRLRAPSTEQDQELQQYKKVFAALGVIAQCVRATQYSPAEKIDKIGQVVAQFESTLVRQG